MELEEALKIVQDAGYRVKGQPKEIEHPDDYWMTDEEKQNANRWEQIGAHENIARRRARAQGRTADEKYIGPTATLEEREKAYEEFLTNNPHIARIDL